MAAIGAGLISLATPPANSGIQASPVDTRKYFPEPRLEEFVAAVQRGDLAKVREGLRAGISPNAQGRDGFTPIFFIFPARNAEVARELLQAGANPNAKLPDGTPVLQFAVRMANPEFTRALLEFKADPNTIGEYEQPVIHEAVHAEAPKNIQLLAQAGADINVEWGGGTPLLNAVDGGSWTVATMLLNLGADTRYRTKGGRLQYTADESLCNLMPPSNPPLPTANPCSTCSPPSPAGASRSAAWPRRNGSDRRNGE